MADNDKVVSIIAAMSTSKDGWHLSCDLDNIRNDGKIVAAFNVGYGDTLYVLAMGNYGNDGKSDLVQGVMYVPGDHPRSSNIFIRTPMWVRLRRLRLNGSMRHLHGLSLSPTTSREMQSNQSCS